MAQAGKLGAKPVHLNRRRASTEGAADRSGEPDGNRILAEQIIDRGTAAPKIRCPQPSTWTTGSSLSLTGWFFPGGFKDLQATGIRSEPRRRGY